MASTLKPWNILENLILCHKSSTSRVSMSRRLLPWFKPRKPGQSKQGIAHKMELWTFAVHWSYIIIHHPQVRPVTLIPHINVNNHWRHNWLWASAVKWQSNKFKTCHNWLVSTGVDRGFCIFRTPDAKAPKRPRSSPAVLRHRRTVESTVCSFFFPTSGPPGPSRGMDGGNM